MFAKMAKCKRVLTQIKKKNPNYYKVTLTGEKLKLHCGKHKHSWEKVTSTKYKEKYPKLDEWT